MIILVVAGGVAGIALGWQFRVIALVPGIFGTVIAVTFLHLGDHQSPRAFVIALLVALASLQIGYVLGRVLQIALRSSRLHQMSARAHQSDSEVPRY